MLLELCVTTVEAAIEAEKHGADRIELCLHLECGGLTPSAGMIEQAAESLNIPLHVLIRPRPGNFYYNNSEFDLIRKEVVRAVELGADGVVLGSLNEDRSIQADQTAELVDLAEGAAVTFHRAFDLVPDPKSALDLLLDLQVDRLLTSGGQPTAPEGASVIRDLANQAADDLVILPGSGINHQNVRELVAFTGVTEVHFSAMRHLVDGSGPDWALGKPVLNVGKLVRVRELV